jgi:hypothetical protein
MDLPSVNFVVDPTYEPKKGPVLSEVSISLPVIQIDMQKLIGVVFARLSAVEHAVKTRLDRMEARLDTLEKALAADQRST